MKRRAVFCCVLLFLGGFAAGWVAEAARNPRAAMTATAGPSLLTVPDVYQSTDYSCGASALQAVLAYWGIEVRDATLMKSLGTTEKYGTSPENILRVAQSYGLKAEMRENLAVADIAAALGKGVPAIVDIQAWPDQEAARDAWDRDWEDGHYVVAIGVDPANLYVEDPSLLNCRGFIPIREFESRWHDYEGEPPYTLSRRAYVRMAIFIEGTGKQTPKVFSRVD